MSVVPHLNAVWPEGTEAYLPGLMLAACLLALCGVGCVIKERLPATSWSAVKAMPLVQWTILALLVDVWSFLYLTIIVLFGVGTSRIDPASGIPITCITTVWGAVLLYGGAKLCVLTFLAERVYLVHSHTDGGKITRFKSWWYRASLSCVAIWLVVGIIDILGKNSYIREEDGACILGIKPYASIALLIMDFIVNGVLTIAFVIPIYKSNSRSLQWLAKKSVFAALAGFISTTANFLIMTIMGGKQISSVNLGACGLDLLINSLVIHFITSSDRGNGDTASSDHPTPIGGRQNGYPGILVSMESFQTADRGPKFIPSGTGGAGRRGSYNLGLNTIDSELEGGQVSEKNPSSRTKENSVGSSTSTLPELSLV